MRGLFLTLVAASWFGGTAALAAPKVTETVRTYPVSATTSSALKDEMRSKGPKGYWAYTRWDIRWSGGCEVQVKVTYTLPKHANPEAMSPTLRRNFDRMLANLTAHERQHGQHGIDAAHEIHRANCNGAQKIIRKYNRIDLEFDKRTGHGAREGVELN